MKKDRHAKVEVLCMVCGKTFFARKERVLVGLGRFCSRDCYNSEQRNMATKAWGRKDLARRYKTGERYVARWYSETGEVISVAYPKWWWEMNVGEIPDGMIVIYRDGNSLNIDPSNFELGTRSDSLVQANKTRKKDPEYWEAYTEKLRQKQLGFKHTPESKAKISKIHKGKKLSIEHKNKISLRNIELWKNGSFDFHKGSKNRAWKKNKSTHPKEFNDDLKEFIRQRDNYVCQICGKDLYTGRQGSVHHIDGVKSHNDPENLILLCGSCHMKVHFSTGSTSPVIMAFRSKLLE